MNIFQMLTYGSPLWADGIFVDVSGQNFVDHLSIDAHGWVGEGLAVILGLMVFFPRSS